MRNNFQKILILVLIIFLGFFCYVFYFLYNQISKNSVSTDEITSQWQQEVSKNEEIKILNHGVKAVEKETIELEKHFAKNSDIGPFLDTIEQLAPKVGAIAETTSVDLSPDKMGLIVGLKVKGKFVPIYKFLTLLENSPYELEILSFKVFNIEKTSDWESDIQIRLISFTN